MSGQSYVQVPPDSTGKKMDTSVTSTAAQHRQVMAIGDPLTDANVAAVGANGLKTDGSGVTQPISGSVTTNAGSNTSTAALALETGGNLASIATSTSNSATSANQTNGNQQTKITDGTNVANVNAVSGKNGLYVASNSATGSAVPANAFYFGISGPSGNLTGMKTISQNSVSGDGGNNSLTAGIQIYNGSAYDQMKSATAASNTTGTGLLGAGVLGYDGTNYQRAYTNATGGQFVQGATKNSAVAVSSSATVVKNSAGYLSGALVTVAGTATAMTIYDNASAASGTIIGYIPSGAVLGGYYPFNMPATNGITVSGSATNPAVTLAYS